MGLGGFGSTMTLAESIRLARQVAGRTGRTVWLRADGYVTGIAPSADESPIYLAVEPEGD